MEGSGKKLSEEHSRITINDGRGRKKRNSFAFLTSRTGRRSSTKETGGMDQ